MSNINQPVVPAAPTTGPAVTTTGGDANVDAYQRAVQARPTAFAENPIGVMANAMDRFGRAAGNMFKGTPEAGLDGLGPAEANLLRANQAAKANPNSLAAKQEQMKAALSLLGEMQHLAPNDPRRLKVAEFVVKLGNQLGAQGIPFNAEGLDVRGLLRLAAHITSKFGDANGMQLAFSLEGILRASMPGSSVEAVRARELLMQQLGLSRSSIAAITNNWAVRLTAPGELPSLDVSTRTMSINAALENPSLSVLARAFWNDQSLTNPADKDGFMAAFLKIASSGGAMAVLSRKYKELRRMARHELSNNRTLGTVGVSNDAPVLAVTSRAQRDDESGDMFAALAVFSRSEGGHQLPDSVRPALQRFFA